VIGALLAGFALIHLMGITATIYIAAALNLLVALVAIRLATRVPVGEPVSNVPAKVESLPITPLRRRLVLGALFLSGFAAMACQVCFFRIVGIGFGSTVYSFTVVVAAFITGLTLGSALLVRLPIRDPYRFFGLVQWGVVLTFLLQLPLFHRIPYFAVLIRTQFDLTSAGFYAAEATKAGAVLGLLLLPTMFMGMSFPLAAQLCSDRMDALGRRVGFVYGFSTVGNLFGAIGSSILLLPWLGLEGTFYLVLGLSFLSGALIVGSKRNAISPGLSVTLAAVFCCSLGLWNVGWTIPINHTVESVRIHTDVPESFDDYCKRVVKYPPKFMQEDATATVIVFESMGDPVLAINGKIQATGIGDVRTEMLEAHIPLLLHPAAQDVLAIGLGSGVTIGAALQHPIARMDVVELSPGVVQAAETCFRKYNHDCLRDPRVRLYVEDGAAFVKTTRQKYDVILNTISHPWVAGVGNLMSIEYFRDCAERLQPDGVMLLWIHLYEMDDATARIILRSFLRVFPHVSTWMSQNDALLVGSRMPIPVDVDQIRQRMATELVDQDLSRLGLQYPPRLFCHNLFDERATRALAGAGRVNSQDHPVLDFLAAQMVFRNVHVSLFGEEFGRVYADGSLPPLLDAFARQQPLDRDDFTMIVAHLSPQLKADDPILIFYRNKMFDSAGR
jgi:spermidine synthase